MQDVQGDGDPPAPPAPFHRTGLRILWVSVLLHLGHSGFSSVEKTSSSNVCLQLSQRYSKMGMKTLPLYYNVSPQAPYINHNEKKVNPGARVPIPGNARMEIPSAPKRSLPRDRRCLAMNCI